jgi:type I restriction enzyme S subunit
MSLSDFVEINPKVSLEKGKEYPFVAMEDIVLGQRYVSATCGKRYAGGGAKFQVGDVLFGRITPCLENGKIAQFAGADGQLGFGSTEFFVFRAKDRVSDPAYVFYLAYTDIVRKPAEKSMSGASGRQRADLNAIRNLEVPTPPLTTQRKIAAILSAYDDLIENNTRRIKILGEMARMIYQEWFVYFRFPGHGNVKMVESELGLIPEGWEAKPIGEVVETLGGGTPSTKNPEYWEGGDVTWFIPSDLTKSGNMFISDSEKKITRLGLEKSSARLFPAYSVMMTSRATIGVVAITTKQACTNQGFIKNSTGYPPACWREESGSP